MIEDINVHRLQLGTRQVTLIGTAHVSHESAELVRRIIEDEQPDTVCVELCDSRMQTIRQKKAWQEMDIVRVIREKKTFVLLINFLMAAFQRRMADQLKIKPGQEMLTAIELADAQQKPLALIDRDVRTTLSRVWGLMGFWSRMKLINQVFASLFEEEEPMTEEQLESMKQQGALELLLEEMGRYLPDFKKYLIDERDLYMVAKIREAPGERMVAVVGAGHVPGMLAHWEDATIDVPALETQPQGDLTGKILQWGLPLLLLGLLGAGFFMTGKREEALEKGIQGIILWVSLNSGLAALGTLIARGHPFTILTAIIGAPFATLHPLVGISYMTALVEAWARKPKVKDFEALPEDILTVKGWWHNQVTRVLLVFILSGVGGALGNFIAYGILFGRLFGKT